MTERADKAMGKSKIVTHAELDQLGPDLEAACNREIARRFRAWSHYAVERMLNEIMLELAPDWSWRPRPMIGGTPQIMITSYNGEIETGAEIDSKGNQAP